MKIKDKKTLKCFVRMLDRTYIGSYSTSQTEILAEAKPQTISQTAKVFHSLFKIFGHPSAYGVPWPEMRSEPQLQLNATAAATPDT